VSRKTIDVFAIRALAVHLGNLREKYSEIISKRRFLLSLLFSALKVNKYFFTRKNRYLLTQQYFFYLKDFIQMCDSSKTLTVSCVQGELCNWDELYLEFGNK